VVAFLWKLLLDRIPTRRNLARQNCLPSEAPTVCVLCGRAEESSKHLFLHCNVTNYVWRKVKRWLDFSFITPNLFVHWECWSMEGRNKRIGKGLWLIWHTTIWVIWPSRNHMIFQNEAKEIDDLVEEIMVISWRRSLSRLNISTCLYYERSWEPQECLTR